MTWSQENCLIDNHQGEHLLLRPASDGNGDFMAVAMRSGHVKRVRIPYLECVFLFSGTPVKQLSGCVLGNVFENNYFCHLSARAHGALIKRRSYFEEEICRFTGGSNDR